MGFGGNLVQGFRAYAWRAVPSFPKIALCFPSLALRPQPFPVWWVMNCEVMWIGFANEQLWNVRRANSIFGLVDKRSLPKSRRQNFGFWPMGGSLTLNLTFFLQNIRQLNTWFFWALPFVGKGKYTKSDEFLEKFQTAFDHPPLIFGKLYCKLFMTDVVAYMEGDMTQLLLLGKVEYGGGPIFKVVLEC